MKRAAIIVSYKTGPALWDCLERALEEPALDTIVLADAGNDAATRARLAEVAAAEPKLTLMTIENHGFGANCNRAARAVEADSLLFLNPDAVLEPGAAKLLFGTLEGRPLPALVGGAVADREGRITPSSSREHPTFAYIAGVFFGFGRRQRWARAQNWRSIHAPIRTQAISGAFFAMRRRDFLDLGGFDEAYFMHVEDLDLCRRLEAAGGEVWFHPQARVTHWGATSDIARWRVEWRKARGLIIYLKKFSNAPWKKVAASALSPLISALAVARALLLRR